MVNVKSLLLDNTSVRQTIFKNTFWLGLGIGANRLLKLALLVYAARILEAAEYGKFTFALAFVSLFVVFNDFGLSTIVTREFSKEKEEKEEFYSLISLKALLTIAAFCLIALSSFFVTEYPDVRKLILILAVFSLLNGFGSFFYSFFQARQRMEYETWVEVLQAIFAAGFGFLILFKMPSIINLGYGYLTAALFGLAFTVFIFRLKFFSLKILWQKAVWKKFLLMSWPLAFVGLFGLIYSYIDSVMMGYWNMMEETGWYNAASRINSTVFMVVGLICSSFYPVLSKLFKESKEELQKIWNYEIQLMSALSFFLVVAGVILASKIINFLYGAGFAPSILAFQILMAMVGVALLNTVFNHLLIASGQEKKIFWIVFAGALANVAANLILIPRFSLYGAALATLLSHLLIFCIAINVAKQSVSVNLFDKKVLLTITVSVLSALLMAYVLLLPAVLQLNLFLEAFIAVFTYSISFISLTKISRLLWKQ